MYHWKIVVDLAWFSSTTHLSALTLLRNHFHNHPRQRALRLVFMSCMLVLLFAAILPLGHLMNGWTRAAYAKCFFKPPKIELFQVDELFLPSILLLTYGYIVRGAKLFGTSSVWGARTRNWARSIAHRNLGKLNELTLARYMPFRLVVQIPALTVYAISRFFLDLLISMTMEVSKAQYAT
jgi:hypothetical protein